MIGILPYEIINLGILGFMLIYAVCLIISGLNKYIGAITFPIMLIIGLNYWDYYVTGNTELFWLAIFSWLGAVFIIFETIMRIKNE